MPEYKYLPAKDFRELIPGKLIRHKLTDAVYQVANNFGDRVTAVRIVDVTNLSEWEFLSEDTTKDVNPN